MRAVRCALSAGYRAVHRLFAHVSKYSFIKTPSQLVSLFDQQVHGQYRAKRDLAAAVYSHYMSLAMESELQLSRGPQHLLLVGPTGTGKTLLVRTLAEALEVPVAFISATALVEAGYRGRSAEDGVRVLLEKAEGNVARAELGIIFVDEIDKIARADNTGRDVSGEGVQNAFLTLLDGRPVDGSDSTRHATVDTRKVLFICAGAFADLPDVIRKRIAPVTHSVGFHPASSKLAAPPAASDRPLYDLYRQAQTRDFVEYGMIPEFMGRFATISFLHEMTNDDVRHLVTGRRANCPIVAAERMANLHGILLRFTEQAIDYLASQTVIARTGIRGLTNLVGQAIEPMRFSWPDLADKKVRRVLVDWNAELQQFDHHLEYGNVSPVRLDQFLRGLPVTMAPQNLIEAKKLLLNSHSDATLPASTGGSPSATSNTSAGDAAAAEVNGESSVRADQAEDGNQVSVWERLGVAPPSPPRTQADFPSPHADATAGSSMDATAQAGSDADGDTELAGDAQAKADGDSMLDAELRALNLEMTSHLERREIPIQTPAPDEFDADPDYDPDICTDYYAYFDDDSDYDEEEDEDPHDGSGDEATDERSAPRRRRPRIEQEELLEDMINEQLNSMDASDENPYDRDLHLDWVEKLKAEDPTRPSWFEQLHGQPADGGDCSPRGSAGRSGQSLVVWATSQLTVPQQSQELQRMAFRESHYLSHLDQLGTVDADPAVSRWFYQLERQQSNPVAIHRYAHDLVLIGTKLPDVYEELTRYRLASLPRQLGQLLDLPIRSDGVLYGRYHVVGLLGYSPRNVVLQVVEGNRFVALKIPREPKTALLRYREGELRLFRSHIRGLDMMPEEFSVPSNATYMAMEYCPGGSLADLLLQQKGRLRHTQTLTLLRSAARTVDWLHRNQLLLNNLAPESLLLRTPDTIQPTLSSVATLPDLSINMRFILPRIDQKYAAPELLAKGAVSEKADQFALAATFVHAMVGRRITGGRKTKTITADELLARLPGRRGTTAKRLARVLSRAVSESPDDRWPNLATMLRELRSTAP